MTLHIAPRLEIDRLFSSPALGGPALAKIRIAPDAQRVIYLRGREQEKDRLDLWVYEVAAGASRLLLDADDFAATEALSAEERARRERQRTSALSGILEYALAPDGGSILVTLAGRLYLIALEAASERLVVNPRGSAATDAAFSPCGGYLAFVRGQNLELYDIARRRIRALTSDGGGAIKNGMAEFVAQEEMNRSTGYWWAPDARHIAFVRIDESPVSLTERLEIMVEGIATHVDRYPTAGTANVAFRVGVIAVPSGRTQWLDFGAHPDSYLARVDWLPDGKTLALQCQSRDQRRVDLIFADIDSARSRVVLTETSPSWIDLNDELTFLDGGARFIWASASDGYTHLYLHESATGRLLHRLTLGPWNVDDFRERAIKCIDETSRAVYFTATEAAATERHLYRVCLDGKGAAGAPRRISCEPGIHAIVMRNGAPFYVDHFSNEGEPPSLQLRTLDGRRCAYIVENRLDDHHPYARYRSQDCPPRFGSMAAADGQELHYRLFTPPKFDPAAPHPAIIEVYGGPGVQRVVRNFAQASFAQLLARAGYVVFQLDNRGTAHRGQAFQAPIQGRLGDIEVADQLAGARWLGAQPFVDANRIGVWGWSYGGYLALMLLCQPQSLFRAGVAGAPVTDWSLYDTHYTERFLGTPAANPASYAMSSVLTHAPSLAARLLLIHGMADDNVLLVHSLELLERLQRLGKRFDLMLYPGAKHGLLREPQGRHAYATIRDFFDGQLRA